MSLKSPQVLASEAKRLATRALDRANEAHALAESNRLAIAGLEARNAESAGRIASELATIREILGDIVRMLTSGVMVPKQENPSGPA